MRYEQKIKLNKMMLEHMRREGLSHLLSADLLVKYNREISDQAREQTDSKKVRQAAIELLGLGAPYYFSSYVSEDDLFGDVYRWTGVLTGDDLRTEIMTKAGYILMNDEVTLDTKRRTVWKSEAFHNLFPHDNVIASFNYNLDSPEYKTDSE